MSIFCEVNNVPKEIGSQMLGRKPIGDQYKVTVVFLYFLVFLIFCTLQICSSARFQEINFASLPLPRAAKPNPAGKFGELNSLADFTVRRTFSLREYKHTSAPQRDFLRPT